MRQRSRWRLPTHTIQTGLTLKPRAIHVGCQPSELTAHFVGEGQRVVRLWLSAHTTHNKEMMVNLRPLSDRLVVKLFDAPGASPGGILLPDSAKKRPARGQVVAVGPGKRLADGQLVPLQVAVGHVVLFSTYAGNDVDVGGVTYTIMREDDILGVEE